MQENNLTNQHSLHLNDVLKENRIRADLLRRNMNTNGATILLAVGIHYDRTIRAFIPVVCGSTWINQEETVALLEETLQSLKTKTLDDANG